MGEQNRIVSNFSARKSDGLYCMIYCKFESGFVTHTIAKSRLNCRKSHVTLCSWLPKDDAAPSAVWPEACKGAEYTAKQWCPAGCTASPNSIAMAA